MIDFEDWVKTQVLDEHGYIAYRPELWPEKLREGQYRSDYAKTK